MGRNAMEIAPRKWTVNATARGVEEKAVCRGPLDGSTARKNVRPHIRTAADAGAEKEAGLGRPGLGWGAEGVAQRR